VTITKQSTLQEVALAVGAALGRHGVKAVLTGGACASIHSAGVYTSRDLDFVVTNQTTRQTLDLALGDVGFNRSGDRYLHPDTQFWVEFPRGPLAVGGDSKMHQTTRRGTAGSANVLSVTDSCHDRLSLEVAMHIARRQKVTLRKIRQWSEQADRLDQFLVAPPGCEPGMEVVQTGRPVTRLVRKLAHIARSQRHARSLAVRTSTQE